MKILRILSMVCLSSLVLYVSLTQATVVTIEPDDYLLGQDLNNVVPGVTLSVADGDRIPQVDDKVEAYQGDFASTGILVFGRHIASYGPDGVWFLQDIFVHSIFRADFQVPVDQVSIDVIRLDSPSAVDEGALLAYDASGALLDSAIVSLGAPGTFSTATISSPTANIAYILAGGYPETSGPPWSVVALDNLRIKLASTLVTIDIKPTKKTENVINLKKKDLKVVIVGSTTFDALQVDPETVKFGTFDPDAASPTRFKGQDYNGDGYSDLILTFKLSDTGIVCGVTEATLTGETSTDPVVEIQGTDSFTIKKCP